MMRRGLDRALMALELTTLALAVALIAVGGYQGKIFGIALSARSAYRPLLLFSVVFLARAWSRSDAASLERRALEFIYQGWRGDVPRENGSSLAAGRAKAVLAGLAAWASLGASLALSETVAIAVLGYSSLFPGPAILFVFAVCATLIYAIGAVAMGIPALLPSALSLRLSRASGGLEVIDEISSP